MNRDKYMYSAPITYGLGRGQADHKVSDFGQSGRQAVTVAHIFHVCAMQITLPSDSGIRGHVCCLSTGL